MKLKSALAGFVLAMLLPIMVVFVTSCTSADTQRPGPNSEPSSSIPTPLPSPTTVIPTLTSISPSSPMVEGVINSRSGESLVVNTAGGNVLVDLTSSTPIKRADGSSGVIKDLQAGVAVQIYYSPATRHASLINIKSSN